MQVFTRRQPIHHQPSWLSCLFWQLQLVKPFSLRPERQQHLCPFSFQLAFPQPSSLLLALLEQHLSCPSSFPFGGLPIQLTLQPLPFSPQPCSQPFSLPLPLHPIPQRQHHHQRQFSQHLRP